VRTLLAALSAAVLFVAGALPVHADDVVEVKATGTPGQAAAERILSFTATVKAVDVKARTVTLAWRGGETGAFKVGPEVKGLGDLRPGDAVLLDVAQQLTLEVQLPGSPSVPLAVAGGDGAAVGLQGTVTVTAVDLPSRKVTFQDSAGSTYEVKAGPGLAAEKLKKGDRLLATFVEAIAVRLEKAPKKP
jgi:Cu/Ag efflux protein CusF